MGAGSNESWCVLLLASPAMTMACSSVGEHVGPFGGSEAARMLIVTADDYGASAFIDAGIHRAIRGGAVTTVSAFANYQETGRPIARLARDHPGVGVGVHLNVTSGSPVLEPSEIPSLIDDAGRFFPLPELIPRLPEVSIEEL